MAVAFSLLSAGPSAAAVNGEFFGLQAWEKPGAAEFGAMAQGKVGTFRMNFLWSEVEARPGLRYWHDYDEIVLNATRANVALLPVILGSPRFAAKQFQDPPRSSGAKRAYARFAGDLVGRYGRGGKFWRTLGRNLPYRPIKAWQVWNEPNFPAYWNGKPNAREYAGLLRITHREVKRRDRKAQIVLGGMPESTSGVPVARYLKALYRVRGIKGQFDVLALHVYSASPSGVDGLVKRARRLMNRYGDSRTPIWLTEVGWASGGPSTRFTTSLAGQASRLEQAFGLLVKHIRRYRLKGVVWFSLRDRQLFKGERDWWAPHTGLFDVSGGPKPAWQAFTRFTGGGATPPAGSAAPPTQPPPGPSPGPPPCPLLVIC